MFVTLQAVLIVESIVYWIASYFHFEFYITKFSALYYRNFKRIIIVNNIFENIISSWILFRYDQNVSNPLGNIKLYKVIIWTFEHIYKLNLCLSPCLFPISIHTIRSLYGISVKSTNEISKCRVNVIYIVLWWKSCMQSLAGYHYIHITVSLKM